MAKTKEAEKTEDRGEIMKIKPKIGVITLGVKNLDKSIKFYRDGLGLPVESQDEDIIFFKMGELTLALYLKEKLAEDANVSSKSFGFSGFTLAHCLSSKEKVDEAFKIFVKAGGKPIKKPQEVFWGGYSSYISDPDGYLWEIAYNPFTDRT